MTDSSCKPSYSDAYTQFRNWLKEQPYWLQDAAFRIFHGQPIDDTQIDAYVGMCVAQAKKQKTDYKHIDENDVEHSTITNRVSVLSISEIVGVNALAADAKLDFSPEGVTVIYGLNGAGKSGFMRIFKRLSGSPYEEPIQPNIFRKTEGGKPSCAFTVCYGAEERSIKCDLSSNAKSSILSDCDVFDTRISNAYITNTNNPSYQPFVFTVLSELSKVADRISKQIHADLDSITVRPLEYPANLSFSKQTEWVQGLSSNTTIPESFLTWQKEQEDRLIELPKLLDADNVSKQLQLLRIRLQSIKPVLGDLLNAQKAMKALTQENKYAAYLSAKKRAEAAEKLFSDAADEIDRISISSDDWKLLWRTAKQYYERYIFSEGCKHFGEEGTICPLCHQEINGTIFTRYSSVNEYVNGSCSEDFRKSEISLCNDICAIYNRQYTHKQIEQGLASSIDDDSITTISDVYKSFERIEEENEIDTQYSMIRSLDLDAAIAILNSNAVKIEQSILDLENALKDEQHVALRHEYDDLQCCKWIFDSLATITSTINHLKRKKDLLDALSLTTTNRITSEANKLAAILITAAYVDRFTYELNRLAPNVKVRLEKAPSRKGNSPYKVTLDSTVSYSCKTEDVLSEGEQRIVALAAFFADATGRDGFSPLIIDDPISSLDLNYETSATTRIVELARDRQVIVFTHRISMLTGIQEACQRLGVKHTENYIRSTSRGKGVADLPDVYRGDVKKHLTGIQQRLIQIRKIDPDSSEYFDALGKQCQQFRICIERSVEDVLLIGMVHRFERRIMTNGKLTKLTRITEDDCSFVDSMMTKYSFTEHSQPIDSPPIEINIDELNTDIGNYITWIKEFNKRMS